MFDADSKRELSDIGKWSCVTGLWQSELNEWQHGRPGAHGESDAAHVGTLRSATQADDRQVRAKGVKLDSHRKPITWLACH